MAAFDRFPAPVRRALAAGAFDTRAEQLHRDLALLLFSIPADVLAQALVANLAETEERTLARANREFWNRFGRDLPHVAARATILR
jgi:hypothetical protein